MFFHFLCRIFFAFFFTRFTFYLILICVFFLCLFCLGSLFTSFYFVFSFPCRNFFFAFFTRFTFYLILICVFSVFSSTIFNYFQRMQSVNKFEKPCHLNLPGLEPGPVVFDVSTGSHLYSLSYHRRRDDSV